MHFYNAPTVPKANTELKLPSLKHKEDQHVKQHSSNTLFLEDFLGTEGIIHKKRSLAGFEPLHEYNYGYLKRS